MLNYLVLFSALFLLSTQNSKATEKKKDDTPPKEMHIYLLIGQSNMAGRATIECADQDTLQNVFLFTGEPGKEWEKAANPLNKYSTIRKDIKMQKLGPGYTFAKSMAEFYPEKEFGLVVNAKGGTSIDLWGPESDFFREAVKRTKAAMPHGTLKGVLWHQGESDASRHEMYMPKLLELIAALRSEFGISDLPFVAGQLSSDKPSREGFNKMILELPGKMENTAVVKSNDTSTIDSTHFDSVSQRLLGERYAREMLKLTKN